MYMDMYVYMDMYMYMYMDMDMYMYMYVKGAEHSEGGPLVARRAWMHGARLGCALRCHSPRRASLGVAMQPP